MLSIRLTASRRLAMPSSKALKLYRAALKGRRLSSRPGLWNNAVADSAAVYMILVGRELDLMV